MIISPEKLTIVANFLNSTFSNFDYTILSWLHTLAVNAGSVFTPIFKAVSMLAEKGLVFIILSIIFMLFKRTRKLGICMFGAIACGAIMTNFVLKDFIARPRPFEYSEVYASWWQAAGAVVEDGFSFPSGHATATMAAMTAVFLCCNKKYSWTGFLLVMLMGMSRNYLMAHFPSDILGGALVGFIGAVIAYYITKLIYYVLSKNPNNKFCKFVLDFSIIKKK